MGNDNDSVTVGTRCRASAAPVETRGLGLSTEQVTEKLTLRRVGGAVTLGVNGRGAETGRFWAL
jgi:hypothetical protein